MKGSVPLGFAAMAGTVTAIMSSGLMKCIVDAPTTIADRSGSYQGVLRMPMGMIRSEKLSERMAVVSDGR